MSDIFIQITEKIIKAQENIIGPIAVEQAKKVHGLTLDWQNKKISIEGNKKDVLAELIKNYEHLFGQASVEVCKNAIKGMLDDVPKDQLPSVLAT